MINGKGQNVLKNFNIVDINYISLCYKDFQTAIDFYTQVLGAPENVDEGGEIGGWQMGATWLTLFPTKEAAHPGSNPRNAEITIQVD